MWDNVAQLAAANKAAGNFWFEPDTMRFFKTRICDGGRMHGGRFFVTSERNSYDDPRLYSVRVGNDDGTVETVGEFQQYATLSQAIAAAQRYADTGTWRHADGSVRVEHMDAAPGDYHGVV